MSHLPTLCVTKTISTPTGRDPDPARLFPYDPDLFDAFVDAMWRGDTERLGDMARCRCCCDEHTFASCPARARCDCRGQAELDLDEDGWYRVYAEARGMTRAEFFCLGLWDEGERPPAGHARASGEDGGDGELDEVSSGSRPAEETTILGEDADDP
jgi:hypothetical protein